VIVSGTTGVVAGEEVVTGATGEELLVFDRVSVLEMTDVRVETVV